MAYSSLGFLGKKKKKKPKAVAVRSVSAGGPAVSVPKSSVSDKIKGGLDFANRAVNALFPLEKPPVNSAGPDVPGAPVPGGWGPPPLTPLAWAAIGVGAWFLFKKRR